MGKSTKDGRRKSASMPTVRIDRKNKQAIDRKKGAPKEGWIWSLPVENQERIGKCSFDEWSPH